MKVNSLKVNNWGGGLLLFFLFGLLLVNSGQAHSDPNSFWTPGEPIVPCGISPTDSAGNPRNLPSSYYRACDECQTLHLIRHVIDFILIAATPVLGTLFFIVAGVYMMLGGGNPGMLSQGKRIFTSTLIGIVIVMLAWLLTNTIIRSLSNQTGNWYEFDCPWATP